MKKNILILILILFGKFGFSQDKKGKYFIKKDTDEKTYLILNSIGDTIKKLSPDKYFLCFTSEFENFAVFGLRKRKNWFAIDINEKILFKVLNTIYGEPSPDFLRENRIRLIDEENKIGYANEKGKITIQPKFKFATSFYKGKAIIGENCEKVLWSHENESDCKHYSLKCKKYGYINKKGKILKLGKYSFENIRKEIKWKPYENY